MRTWISLLVLCFIAAGSIAFAQFDFSDNFDSYVQGAPLACQNPADWTTWNLTPCDGIEDPIITTTHFYSSPKSVVIFQYNNLVKPLGDDSTGRDYVNFEIYIPSGKSGYFNFLSDFTSMPYQKAMECYFDADGTGRLMTVPGAPITFDYTQNQWHYVQTVVDFDLDEAQFWFDGSPVYFWQWTQNGAVDAKLAGNNFYGPYSSNQYYIDDYLLFHEDCLQCVPPVPPESLTVQEIWTTGPLVQLDWEYSSLVNGFKVIRKSGLPGSPGSFEQIGSADWNAVQFVDSNVVVDSTYTYGLMAFTIYGYSDTSNFVSITIAPIPVELVSFTGNLTGEDIRLSWTTATETNNRGFEVQRSEIRSRRSEWESKGFVEGNGTSSVAHSYSYTDRNPAPGKYVYRLKQIDYDGSNEYSDEVEVNVIVPLEFSLEQNYPNPFNPVTTIKYSIPAGTSFMKLVQLKVYNSLGEEAAALVNEEKPAGIYEVEFDGSDLPSGVYIYRLTAGNYSASKKLILLK